jgi:nucleoside-diphosphate-sugar epimerase
MNMLIVGGTRFIGPPVVRQLVAAGHNVTVFHRGENEAELPPGVRHRHGSREEAEELRDAVRSVAPDVVIDMAALTEADARATVDAARNEVGRLVVISSQDVYRAYEVFHGTEAVALEPTPYDEDGPLRTALYPYRRLIAGLDDYEKILVEGAAASEAELPATIVRLPAVYGEGDYQHRLAREIRRIDDGRRAIILDERIAAWRWTRLYVENAAAAIVLAATARRADGRVYNVGDEALSYAEWVAAVGEAAGWEGQVITLSGERLPKHLRPPPGNYAQDLVAETTRIRDELGYEDVVSRDEGLRRAIAWERANRGEIDKRALDYAAEDALLETL